MFLIFSEFMFYSGAGMPIITQGEIKVSYRVLASSVESVAGGELCALSFWTGAGTGKAVSKGSWM